MANPTPRVSQVQSFVRQYTAGLKGDELRRLFDRDAAEAYAVLTRDQSLGCAEPDNRLRRLWYRVKLVFLGLSYKLSPPRRLLFAAAMLCAVAGLFGVQGVPSLWFLASIGLLAFLLALELVDRVRVRDELEVARELQQDLLPREMPAIGGYRLSHSYRTANEVGGDYYDVSCLGDGRVALAIGDASGHGMAAGLLMAIANASYKLAMDLEPSPLQVVELLNRALFRTGSIRAFMTLFCGLLDPAEGRLEYVCAGHPFPLLRRADATVQELGQGGFPLGVREGISLQMETVTLERGDLLLLYSDGLPEAVDGNGQAFGFERLRSLLAEGGSPERVLQRILFAFDDHLGEEPLRDDLSLVLLARLP